MLEILLRNWPLKLLALGLAFAVRLSLVGEGRVVQDFRVPLDVELGSEAILDGPVPTTINVRLRGPEAVLRRIGLGDLAAQVDLTNAGFGDRNVQLGPDQLVGVPDDVDVEFIDPGRLTLPISKRASRRVPVAPSFAGRPPKGYAFYGAEVSPDTLEIEGPDEKIAGLGRLRTDTIHLDDRTGPFAIRVGAVPDSPNVRVIGTETVEVRAQIDVAPVETAFDAVPVVLAGEPASSGPIPSAVRVVLAGPPALLDALRPAQLRAVADLGGVARDGKAQQVPVRLDFPGVALEDLARISVKSVAPKTVLVRLPKESDAR